MPVLGPAVIAKMTAREGRRADLLAGRPELRRLELIEGTGQPG